jgi:hypothetical protein
MAKYHFQKIDACEAIIDYNFNDRVKCAKALNAAGPGAFLLGTIQGIPRNGSMAVYGDAVAASYLCRTWLNTGLEKGYRRRLIISLKLY